MLPKPGRYYHRKMARTSLIYSAVFIVLSGYAESCVLRSIQADVPAEIQAGHAVSRVYLVQCGSGLAVRTTDPDFVVQTDGTITASRFTTVPSDGRTFSIWVQDEHGHEREVQVNLAQKARKVRRSAVLRRTKRRWSPLPFVIVENDVPPFPKDVEQIGSDSSADQDVYYIIRGPGVTEHPIDVFSINPRTGMVRVNRPVDREEFPVFVFTASVFNKNHDQTDLPLNITVYVTDVNDNAPQFAGLMEYKVSEHSNPGTVIGVIKATDRDDPTTDHAKIRYKLLSGQDLFSINSRTGTLTTTTGSLDRETQPTHFVNVEIRDMDGLATGLTNTATATVILEDINDNPPTFRQSSYSANIEENKANTLVLRIPVDDRDLVNTANWRARFVITKGNETGHFRIDTDPKTNEGLLYVTKPFDYEKTKSVKLEISAQNEAKLVNTKSGWASVPVNINVTNVDEGPEFKPENLYLMVKENVANGTVIGTYTAMDPDTNSSKGIKYYELSDPASWINVVENTGEIRTSNTIDRESVFVTNGMYNITVKAVDQSQKSGTGTVLIKIEDVNDNNPRAISSELVLCESDGTPGSVLVEAEDLDQPPFSSPFTFQLGEGSDGKWQLKDIKGTSAVLEPVNTLPIDVYRVPLMIRDLQGHGEEQTVTVRICRCLSGVCVAKDTSVGLGVWAILAMLLALALLLLLCIFFAFVCSTKREKILLDDGGGGMLLKSNTEGPGDEVDASLALMPPITVDGSTGTFNRKDAQFSKGSMVKSQQSFGDGLYQTSNSNVVMTEGKYGTGPYGGPPMREDVELLEYSGQFSMHNWRTNGLFLDKKLMYLGTEDGGRFADDLPGLYRYEGQGSPAGSLGCCSDFGADDSLSFLDTLGPKFKTLAEVCTKK